MKKIVFGLILLTALFLVFGCTTSDQNTAPDDGGSSVTPDNGNSNVTLDNGGSNESTVTPGLESAVDNIVPEDMPKGDLIITSAPFEEHGGTVINAIIKSESIPANLIQYKVRVRNTVNGDMSPYEYQINKADVVIGSNDVSIEMQKELRTIAPGAYELVLSELYEEKDRTWQTREISTKTIGTFAGADLKVVEWGPPKYYNISMPCCSYSVYRVPMKFRNDGDLPAYPWFYLTIDGETRYSKQGFTEGEPAGAAGVYASGVGQGETVTGYFGLYDWRGSDGSGFAPGKHSITYGIYYSGYTEKLGDFILNNMTITHPDIVDFIGSPSKISD